MIEIDRSSQYADHHTASGASVLLTTRTWSLGVLRKRWGLGIGYTGPKWVEVDGVRVPVRDYLLLVQLTAVAVAIMTRLARRFRP